MSNLFKSPDGEKLAARLCEQSFADFGVLLQFRRRSDGRRDQDRAPLSIRQGPSRALSHHHLRRRVPRPHAGDARRDRLRRNISKASARRWTVSTRCRIGDLEAVKKAIGPHTAGILIEPVQGEGGVRSAPHVLLQGAAPALRRARPAAGVRRGADRHGPHRRSVRLQARRRDAGCDVAGQGARRRFSDRRGAWPPPKPPPA